MPRIAGRSRAMAARNKRDEGRADHHERQRGLRRDEGGEDLRRARDREQEDEPEDEELRRREAGEEAPGAPFRLDRRGAGIERGGLHRGGHEGDRRHVWARTEARTRDGQASENGRETAPGRTPGPSSSVLWCKYYGVTSAHLSAPAVVCVRVPPPDVAYQLGASRRNLSPPEVSEAMAPGYSPTDAR